MKCLHCGKKLPMVKKLTSEEFCSVAHRKAYHDEQEQLALARLLEDQNRRKPARKPLNRPLAEDKNPDFAEHLHHQIEAKVLPRTPRSGLLDLHFQPVTLSPAASGKLAIPRGGLAAPELNSNLVSPFGMASVEDALAALSQNQALLTVNPNAIEIATGAIPQPAQWDATAVKVPLRIDPIEPMASSFECSPTAATAEFALPESNLQPWQHLPIEVMDFTRAAGAQLPFDLAVRFRPVALEARSAESRDARNFTIPWMLQFESGLAGNSGLRSGESADVSASDFRVSAPVFQIRQVSTLPVLPAPDSPTLPFGAARNAIETVFRQACEVRTGIEALPSAAPVPNPPEARSWDFSSSNTRPLAPGSTVEATSPDMVSFAGSIPRLFSRPRPHLPRKPQLTSSEEIPQNIPRALLMAQSRSARLIVARTANKCEPYQELFSHPATFLKSIPGRWAATESLFAFNEPMLPKARIASVRRSTLSVVAKTYRGSRQTGIPVHPDPAMKPPVMREFAAPTKLPLFRPAAKLSVLPARSSHSALSALNHFSGAGYKISWQAMQNRWREAPNDLRWIAMAVPLVIGLIWFAKSPSAQDGAKGRITSIIPNVAGMMNTSFSGDSFEGLKQNIQRRAAVELSDDFRQGLGDWSGVGNWSEGWTYDPAGFIRPRSLALYAPSLGLEDYRFEFLGAIERKALSWVYRAADVKNYYAARLEVTRGGPLPTVELVRYAVINGRPGPRKAIPLPMQGRLDTIYRVRVDVRGSDFVTSVQGQVVDVFSDDRLVRGGVGFFSGPGEDARLRWVEVSHQYDMLGRLCAYLVPYNVTNSNVRSAP